MRRVLTVLGARPQFIKASVVSHAIASTPGLVEVMLHTGQHYDANMSEVFFDELGMNKPDYFLDIHGGSHGAMTGRMLEAVEQVLLQERPDVVLVYGDTNSTLAGALAAAKLDIPVAHVEAGLRSFNMQMPEEINRILTDRISRWLFTPTHTATANLLREGCAQSSITEVGDVMYDVALHHGGRVWAGTGLMAELGLEEKGYVLATIHRQENTDHPQRLATIVRALTATASTLPVVWPLHPRTRAELQKAGLLGALASQVTLIDPLGYLDMVQLEKFAAVIATDSGGVQKEAFFYQVPCVTLRNETEWVELVQAGWNRLVPPEDVRVVQAAINAALGSRGQDVRPYGVGDAARRVVDSILLNS
ncbi:non-hydrolyzing UDP-N-acetylglucosamine 2-epimerase [Pseudomonas anguilliseptica]|uniref:non-hydrolyzing UDP-N-acetylglucosamine 2-epimerase n=1 Tax=Pseudomonas anguilliseptica TaxID=53406 RepID=UPI0022B00E9A|nr:UDP-N-acetylglucosamine 2-epimerase (non-hydrolyzing) [Pseudomonas anguilliseptica]MCZ4323459.1 UDP-N-acetylglucosamine 2-epimerase (non-hydrolyzing) [Pseudomonas anguilliseptica]